MSNLPLIQRTKQLVRAFRASLRVIRRAEIVAVALLVCAVFGLNPSSSAAESSGRLTPQLSPSPFHTASINDPEAAPERDRATLPAGRAGVVYFIGSIGRPGVVPVDLAKRPTLLQALALAGGPSRHAALTKGVLIREREGGRTVTTLNLKRILRGEDPDLPIRDRDIVFVPAHWF